MFDDFHRAQNPWVANNLVWQACIWIDVSIDNGNRKVGIRKNLAESHSIIQKKNENRGKF
jgi:hypothetical protein